mmetsp:Transcript_28903/g.83494  ORF Transcript_28903/g.83494 Transcript_28903/m.83494 type:complete len:309 (+) Transcript_28903:2358-3284(+)
MHGGIFSLMLSSQSKHILVSRFSHGLSVCVFPLSSPAVPLLRPFSMSPCTSSRASPLLTVRALLLRWPLFFSRASATRLSSRANTELPDPSAKSTTDKPLLLLAFCRSYALSFSARYMVASYMPADAARWRGVMPWLSTEPKSAPKYSNRWMNSVEPLKAAQCAAPQPLRSLVLRLASLRMRKRKACARPCWMVRVSGEAPRLSWQSMSAPLLRRYLMSATHPLMAAHIRGVCPLADLGSTAAPMSTSSWQKALLLHRAAQWRSVWPCLSFWLIRDGRSLTRRVSSLKLPVLASIHTSTGGGCCGCGG